jgi:valyl-tRNA synthetase
METYGTDALRFTIIYISPLGQDVMFGEEKCELGRNFATKIWNATRLLFMQREKFFASPDEFAATFQAFDAHSVTLSSAETWLLQRYNAMLQRYHYACSQFRVNDMVKLLYDFFWGDYCDWFLEALKVRLSNCSREEAQQSLALALHVLEGTLQTLHPVMPFLTDEIWHHLLPRTSEESIAVTPMPQVDERLVATDASSYKMVQQLITEIRSLRSLFGVPHASQADILLRPASEANAAALEANMALIATLGQCRPQMMMESEQPRHAASSVVDGNELFVLLEGLISFDKERARLQKEIANIEAYTLSVSKKLANQGFVANAPADVIAKEREKLCDAEDNLQKLKKNLLVLSE